ncbi:hypothetical protein L3X38_001507 [Prunus dulcis]|uniref:Uncharacterized protein n=1 Tax=Prunus dulcis TaxID=3755 RepID=A0AAD4WS59_PRUDU|nr:hypothetical protein L3X38_001507 [Prunus dulcis]
MGEKLGNYLGSFVMVDCGLNEDCWGSFLRIMVGLDHIGSNYELKRKGDITTERYGQWKTMVKDVFSIRLVNGLTRNRIGLGDDETQLDNCASPPKMVGIVCP